MGNIPLWLCIPFAGLLLCIAIFPLVKGEWWDKNKGWAVLIWSLLFIIPFAVKYGAGETAETVLECIVNDYLSFIVLLFGLFCVSGNINLEGDFVGSPRRIPDFWRSEHCFQAVSVQPVPACFWCGR